jgi:DNA ligase-1
MGKRAKARAKSNEGLKAKNFGPGRTVSETFDVVKYAAGSGVIRLVNDLKPMLAETCKDIEKVKYPVLATPKIDGIRCLTMENGTPMSRSLKKIPNNHIRYRMESWGMEGCDGELWIPGATTFGEVSGPIMRVEGTPDFEYKVFDVWDQEGMPYRRRMEVMKERLKSPRPAWVTLVIPEECYNSGGLMSFWNKCADEGYEGAIYRDPAGGYKFGRSTRGMMAKLKVFQDDEAEIIGSLEQMSNQNPAKKNALGRTERSTAKAGKVPAGKLGKFVCRDLTTGIEFECGTGYTDKQRKEFWRDRQVYVGHIIKYKHQPSGGKAKPRFPVFLGFRSKEDMS